jgi:hypothetical protein
MDASDIQLLKDDLTVGAYIPKAPVQPPKFPIYRECTKKMYIPRFYGTKIYGIPDETRIPEGSPVHESLVFSGDMREYQRVIIDKYIHQVTIIIFFFIRTWKDFSAISVYPDYFFIRIIFFSTFLNIIRREYIRRIIILMR